MRHLLPDHIPSHVRQFLEQLQQKWEPVLRPELRKNKEIEHVGEPKFAGRALAFAAPPLDQSLPEAGLRVFRQEGVAEGFEVVGEELAGLPAEGGGEAAVFQRQGERGDGAGVGVDGER